MSLSQCLAIDNGDTIISVLHEALKRWPEWGLVEKPKLISVFDNGKNHHTGLIEAGDTRLVIKVFTHSFHRTIETEYWAGEHCLSPKLRMAANNIALYEFIDDQGFSTSRLSDIANTLKLTHQNRAPSNKRFELMSFCDQYLTTADGPTRQWHKTLIPALMAFNNDRTSRVFCHNDLVTENCLFHNGSVKFIDWEFAQLNNPWFDLAAIIHYFELDNSDASIFLSAYHNGWNQKINDPIFHTAQIAVLWCDLLWNMHCFGNDYWRKNIDRFARLSQLAANINIALPAQPH